MNQKLSTTDHNRDIVGLKYIYPVISRRAGGLSIGINFNINNACNWRCVYCQVPDLQRGAAPEMDFLLLEAELKSFLNQVINGDFYDRFEVLPQHRVIKDIAISGNGEPTSLKQFDKAIALIGQIATDLGVLPKCKFVLITNGSLIHQNQVQVGLKLLNEYQGEVWFKLDSASEVGRKKLNDIMQSNQKTFNNLKLSASLCQTSLQSCMMEYLSVNEVQQEQQAYLQLLKSFIQKGIKLNKVMLYTIARASLQPEAGQLKKLDENQMQKFADQVRRLGYEVSVSL